MRTLPACAALAIIALLWPAATAAGESLAGTWATTVNWDDPRIGLSITLAIGADGRLREHVANRRGMAYDLTGAYTMDSTGRTMRYSWNDYAPRRVCSTAGCSPLGAPDRIGVVMTSRIRRESANAFVGTTADGTSLRWIRIR